jgi:HD-GYP domain-containing protein (c-di-GMP phosphodiesterase class II)
VKTADVGDQGLFETVAEVQELIQELTGRLGFTKEVQQMARENVQLAIKAIGHNPQLSKALAASQLSSKNYISAHSVALANTACAIAGHMQWPSNSTFFKLALAALFHDFTFSDIDQAKIFTKKQLDDLRLKPNDETYLNIKNHPLKCAELVKTLNEVPGDVDIIVAQHHERPDGTGFPKGLRAHQIAPLSAVLIVAHDILNEVEVSGEKFDLKVFLRKSEKEYQGSVFRKVWKALNSPESPAAPEGGSAAA